jgi:tetratricopeptide (TPR) repeat protein
MQPSYLQGYLARADTLYEGGDYQRAAEAFREAVRRFPRSDRAHSFLAWFLATCPDGTLRNGKEAVAEATKACEMVGWKDWGNVDALAAAYAEVGDFDHAVEFMNRLLKMPRPEADAEDERNIQRHMESYKNNQPFRQQPGD